MYFGCHVVFLEPLSEISFYPLWLQLSASRRLRRAMDSCGSVVGVVILQWKH